MDFHGFVTAQGAELVGQASEVGRPQSQDEDRGRALVLTVACDPELYSLVRKRLVPFWIGSFEMDSSGDLEGYCDFGDIFVMLGVDRQLGLLLSGAMRVKVISEGVVGSGCTVSLRCLGPEVADGGGDVDGGGERAHPTVQPGA